MEIGSRAVAKVVYFLSSSHESLYPYIGKGLEIRELFWGMKLGNTSGEEVMAKKKGNDGKTPEKR